MTNKIDKRRITISLDVNTYETIKDFANVTGDSMSKVINDLAGIIAPTMYRVAQSFKSAEKAKESMLNGVIQGMCEGEQELRDLYQQAVDVLDDTIAITNRINNQDCERARRGRAMHGDGLDDRNMDSSPRLVTRGSTTTGINACNLDGTRLTDNFINSKKGN